MAGIQTERNTFYITHSGELLVWLIIILVIISISTIVYISSSKKDNDYTIFMSDVDGLIVGSPVRMMGIEVGHITKIEPAKDEIYVKFLITDKTVTIPQGTVATVEFSGMAGSKSLELYLPDKNTYIDKDVPILTVNPPKRLHDAAGLLSDMFDKLGSIIYTSSAFTDKLKFIEMPAEIKQNQDFAGFLKFSNELIDKQTKRVNDLSEQLKKYQDSKGQKYDKDK